MQVVRWSREGSSIRPKIHYQQHGMLQRLTGQVPSLATLFQELELLLASTQGEENHPLAAMIIIFG